MKFTTTYNFLMKDKFIEKNDEPSQTIPGEAYTIQEIFERSAGGLLDNTNANPIFYDDMDFDDVDFEKLKHLDLTEIKEIKRAVLDREIELKTIKDTEKEKQQDKRSKDKPIQTKTEEGTTEENDDKV